MTPSKSLAQLIGPTLSAMSLSEALNLRIWRINLAPLTYLNGCLLFVAGISIVRAHNVWTRRWPLIVTLVGWGAIVGGLFRMFLPEARQANESPATYAGLALLFSIGAFLTRKGYGGENS